MAMEFLSFQVPFRQSSVDRIGLQEYVSETTFRPDGKRGKSEEEPIDEWRRVIKDTEAI
jgi:hypothetical protein